MRNGFVAVAGMLVLVVLAGSAGGASRTKELRDRRLTAERDAIAHPESSDAQIRLGEACYQLARDALDRGGDERRYLLYLRQGVRAFVRAAELEPESQQPHFYLALIDTYRGEIRSALQGFEIAHQLHPDGVSATNIGEIYVYIGDLDQARVWNTRGANSGAGPGPLAFNQMLIEWKEGDVDRAKEIFERLRASHPEMIDTINVATLPEDTKSFEAFASYCCGSPACGPYMVDACKLVGREVPERNVSAETLAEELRIEREAEVLLDGIYRRRDDLGIEIRPGRIE